MSLKHEKHMRSEIADKTYMTKGWGYVAAFALLPYAILKSLWAWGSPIGLTTKQAVQNVAEFGDTLKEESAFLYTLYNIGIDFTAILAILASLFAIALVTSWREKLPKWLLIILGWSVGVLTVLISFLTALQFLGVSKRIHRRVSHLGVCGNVRRIVLVGSNCIYSDSVVPASD